MSGSTQTSLLLVGSEKQTFYVNNKIASLAIQIFIKFWLFWSAFSLKWL